MPELGHLDLDDAWDGSAGFSFDDDLGPQAIGPVLLRELDNLLGDGRRFDAIQPAPKAARVQSG